MKALESLLQQRERFDYIIIETTGLANPGPVATALWTDAEIESSVCLDAIVTVVDAKNINRHLHEAREGGGVNEAQQQVAFADVILLNKIDLVEAREVEQVERDIAAINAEVDIVRCERCAVDLGGILHTGMYSSSAPKVPELDPNASLLSAENSNGGASGVGDNAGVEMHGEDVNGHDAHEHCGPGCSHPLHANGHDPSVRTVTLRVNRPLCMRRLRHWLDELLWEGQTAVEGTGNDASAGAASALLPEVFRMKGLLHVRASDRKWVLQGVHELYDVVEGPEWPEEQVHSDRGSKVVFIGRHLDGPKLQQGLQACCVDEI